MLAALTVLPSRAAFAQSSTELPEQLRVIQDVRFRGQHALGRREIGYANLKTRRASRLPWRERAALRLDYLRADTAAIAALYRHYGHLDVRVSWTLEPTRDPEAARVVFVIEEGPLSKVSRVDLAGVTAFQPRELSRALLAQPGRAYDPAFLQLDTLRLSALYQERGYRPHTVGSAQRGWPDSLGVAVRYDIHEGPRFHIGRVLYEGSGRLRESLARRELLLRPGDPFRRSRLEQSVERLYGTGLYSQVQVSVVPDPDSAALLDLDLRVSERRPRWVDLGVGSGSAELFRVSGQWGHRNLDTRALLGSVEGELAIDRQRTSSTDASQTLRMRDGRIAAGVVEPWLLGLRLQGRAGLFYEQAADDRDPRFLHRWDSRGFELGLMREFSRLFRASLTSRSALVHQGYDIFADASDPTVPDSLAQVLGRYVDNAITLSLLRDTRDDRVAPNRGSLQSLVLEAAGGPLKGASSYQKLTFVSTWWSPQSNGWQLAGRTTLGVMGPVGDASADFAPGLQDERVARVPKERRFFIGGVNSLRGWAENEVPPDGGLAMLLANLELRMPVWGPLGAEFFVDAGNVWARPEYVQLSDFVAPWDARRGQPGDLRYSYGVGARLMLPFGPLRFDLAWSDHPDFHPDKLFRRQTPFAFQFAIGPSF